MQCDLTNVCITTNMISGRVGHRFYGRLPHMSFISSHLLWLLIAVQLPNFPRINLNEAKLVKVYHCLGLELVLVQVKRTWFDH